MKTKAKIKSRNKTAATGKLSTRENKYLKTEVDTAFG
jgi:hypothetical protein